MQSLARRRTAEPLPTWFFISKGDEILVAHTKNGAASRQHVGSWVVDQDMRLVLHQEMTEAITAHTCASVVDEAVQITAKFIVSVEARNLTTTRELSQLPRRV